MVTTTADVFSLTLYLTARSKRVHVRKHKRLCAMAVFALNLSPERLLNCSVLVRRKLSMRNLDEQRKLRLRYRMTRRRSEEHTSELQSLMRISYAVFCLKKKIIIQKQKIPITTISIQQKKANTKQ